MSALSKILPTAVLAILALTNPKEAEAVHLPKGSQFFHGSAKNFKAFDNAFMGMGEGAQMFSPGHYATESPKLSETYARTAAQRHADREKLIPPEYTIRGTGPQLPSIYPVMPRGYAHTRTNLPGVRASEKPAFLRKKIFDLMEEASLVRKEHGTAAAEKLVDKRLDTLMKEVESRPTADAYYTRMAKHIGAPKKDYSREPIPDFPEHRNPKFQYKFYGSDPKSPEELKKFIDGFETDVAYSTSPTANPSWSTSSDLRTLKTFREQVAKLDDRNPDKQEMVKKLDRVDDILDYRKYQLQQHLAKQTEETLGRKPNVLAKHRQYFDKLRKGIRENNWEPLAGFRKQVADLPDSATPAPKLPTIDIPAYTHKLKTTRDLNMLDWYETIEPENYALLRKAYPDVFPEGNPKGLSGAGVFNTLEQHARSKGFSDRDYRSGKPSQAEMQAQKMLMDVGIDGQYYTGNQGSGHYKNAVMYNPADYAIEYTKYQPLKIEPPTPRANEAVQVKKIAAGLDKDLQDIILGRAPSVALPLTNEIKDTGVKGIMMTNGTYGLLNKELYVYVIQDPDKLLSAQQKKRLRASIEATLRGKYPQYKVVPKWVQSSRPVNILNRMYTSTRYSGMSIPPQRLGAVGAGAVGAGAMLGKKEDRK